MYKDNFYKLLKREIDGIDELKVAKRNETVIEGFIKNSGFAPKAIIEGEPYAIFYSND